MPTNEIPENHNVPWKIYLILTVESVLTFALATFCLAVFITHHGENWLVLGVLLGALYIFIIAALIKRIIQKVSVAALMLIIPIAPFIALATVLLMIPVLQIL